MKKEQDDASAAAPRMVLLLGFDELYYFHFCFGRVWIKEFSFFPLQKFAPKIPVRKKSKSAATKTYHLFELIFSPYFFPLGVLLKE